MFDAANPRQTIVVTCRGKSELLGKTEVRDNAITLSWHSPLSFQPALYGIIVGKTRFSKKLIQESRVFVVNFMLHEHKDDVLMFGRVSGRAADKFDKSGIAKEEAETIDCCRIKEAAAFLECEVVDEIEIGDHIIFVGQVLKSKTNSDGKRLFYLGDDRFTSTLS